MYYFYRKSNWGHGICLLYRGGPLFGGSAINRGLTVVTVMPKYDNRLRSAKLQSVVLAYYYQTKRLLSYCIFSNPGRELV